MYNSLFNVKRIFPSAAAFLLLHLILHPIHAQFDLNSLNGENGFKIAGRFESDRLGARISGIGDINNDGFNDFSFVPYTLDADRSSIAYVIYGKATGFDTEFDFASLDGTAGFQVVSSQEIDEAIVNPFNYDFTKLGDFNDDGVDDFAITETFTSNSISSSPIGRIHIVFGQTSGYGTLLDLSSLNGSNGFTITPTISISLGLVSNFLRPNLGISGNGDINGDEIPDLAITADASAISSINNSLYVLYGSSIAFNSNIDQDDIVDGLGTQLFFNNTISSINLGGDINNDETDDLAVTSINDQGAITIHVIYGSATLNSTLDTDNLNGTDGFIINEANENTRFGDIVLFNGDYNGDGVDDMIISGSDEIVSNTGIVPGNIYVLFGSSTTESTVSLADMPLERGFQLEGVGSQKLGRYLAYLDFNGDNLLDIAFGNELGIGLGSTEQATNSVAGVFYGSDQLSAVPPIDSLNNAGFDFDTPAPDFVAQANIANLGDINGDGFSDLAVGRPFENSEGVSEAGNIYIVFGRANNTPTLANEIPDTVSNGGFDTLTFSLTQPLFASDTDSLFYEIFALDELDRGRLILEVSDGQVKVINNGIRKDLTDTLELQLTAFDPYGGAVSDEFIVISNGFPVAINQYPSVVVPSGFGVFETDSTALFFSDFESIELLTYTATSSDTTVATVEMDGRQVVIKEGSIKGVTNITVTATDIFGASLSLDFEFAVDISSVNAPPVVNRTIPDTTVTAGFGSILIDYEGVFTDPEGEPISYSIDIIPSLTIITVTSLSDNKITIEELNPENSGESTIILRAGDSVGQTDSISFKVVIVSPNQPPVLIQNFDMISLATEEQVSITLNSFIEDPEGSTINYQLMLDDETIVEVGITGGEMAVTGLNEGTTTGTLTAEDEAGGILSVDLSFAVVKPLGLISIDEMLYPNPLDDLLFLKTNHISEITLLSVDGRSSTSFMLQPDQMVLDVSRLSPGLYIIRLTTDEQSHFFKVIKN